MSSAVLINTCPADLAFYPINPGVSPESEGVKKRLEEVRKEDWQSVTKGLRFSKLFESLEEVYRKCSEENWDGYDANPINPKAVLEAKNLILLLPLSFRLPEIIPEPDGSIAFEWYKEKRNLFVISLSGNNVINYAGLFGKVNKVHGTENYTDSLPRVVIENLQRLFT